MAITKISKRKMGFFKNPMYLIIGFMIIIIVILIIYNNYYLNHRIQNIVDKFQDGPDESIRLNRLIRSNESIEPDRLIRSKWSSSSNINCSNGEKNIGEKCICLKEKDKDDRFEVSKENCKEFTELTDCQKQLCKGDNFTTSAANCKNISHYLTSDNQKECCNNFFDSIDSKSLCIPTDVDKFCTTENQKYDYFNKECCKQLKEDNSLKDTFCKEECTKIKNDCSTRPKNLIDMCMKNNYDINCKKYDVNN